MTQLLKRLLADGDGGPPISYEEARELARHESVEVRRALASRSDIVPEILYYLAEDPDPMVRLAIADNAAAPARANELLADDEETDIRLSVARKIAHLAPGLSANEQDRVRRITYAALARLARDQIPRVRAILSETLKDVANAPPEMIRRLARDAEVVVAAPVLEFSPVLTDEDLLEVIRSHPGTGKLSAISKRAGLAEPVSDAIVATDDGKAIASLLANKSAQIREETLDVLVERARAVPAWHQPLVARPRLHADAARRLAIFVADHLVEALMLRKDLDPSTAVAVHEAVHRRLGGDGDGGAVDFGPNWRDELRAAYQDVQDRLKASRENPAMHGRVPGEGEIAAALLNGSDTYAIALIAGLANITPFAVMAAVHASSPKGILAMAWKAGLSAEFGQRMQLKLGRISPDDLIGPLADGGYALGEDEMEWQVEMFCDAEGYRA